MFDCRVIIIQPITEEIIKKSKKKILENNKSRFLSSGKIMNSSCKYSASDKTCSKQVNQEGPTEESSMLMMNNLVGQTNTRAANEPALNVS